MTTTDFGSDRRPKPMSVRLRDAEKLPQPLTSRERLIEVIAVDNCEPKAAGRHGMVLRRTILVKGDLHTGDARDTLYLLHQRRRRVAPDLAGRPEQHHAIAFTAILIIKVPDA